MSALTVTEAVAISGLHAVLVEAAELGRRRGCSVHITRDDEGDLFVSEFLPVGKRKLEWIRVATDGRIEDGNTRKVLGTLSELGL